MNWQILADNLPHATASLNATATVILAFGLAAIKSGNARRHKKLMLSAVGVSGLFLALYLLHKVALYMTTGEANTRYPTDPAVAATWSRYTYYGILGSHLIFAIVVPFLVLRAVWLAKTGRIVAHKKWVRFTYPIWMYVSITGVLVYVFLYHHERFA